MCPNSHSQLTVVGDQNKKLLTNVLIPRLIPGIECPALPVHIYYPSIPFELWLLLLSPNEQSFCSCPPNHGFSCICTNTSLSPCGFVRGYIILYNNKRLSGHKYSQLCWTLKTCRTNGDRWLVIIKSGA